MKLLAWSVLLCLVTYCHSEEVSLCATKCSDDCQSCDCASVNTKKFEKYTETRKNGKPVADAPCEFNPSLGNRCGRCKNGGKQCGTPMQKWCQSPKSRKGCDGVPSNKYTLSTTGGPCYWDHSDLSCAVCKNGKMRQCGSSGDASKCGYFCSSPKDKKCDGNLFNCVQINHCAAGAECIVKKRSSKCQCGEGMTGKGYNSCYLNGTLVTNPDEKVEIAMDTESKYIIYTQDEL